MKSSALPPTRPPCEFVIAGGTFGLIGVGLTGLYHLTGIGVPCGLRMITGWLCPLCGGTRMGQDLLHGDIVGAWNHNGLLLIFIILLGIRLIGWCVEWLVLRRENSARWVPYFISRHGLWIGFVIALGWVLVRNLV